MPISDTFFSPKAHNEHLATATIQLSGVSTKARSNLFRTPTSSRLIHCPLVDFHKNLTSVFLIFESMISWPFNALNAAAQLKLF
jgi:hypothetical protein